MQRKQRKRKERTRRRKNTGFEEIRDEILYVGAEPLGLESGTEFVLYLPEKSVSDLSEEFLSWWPGRYEWDGESESQLVC